MRRKFQYGTFSRTGLITVMESSELNIDSNEVPESTSNQNRFPSETNSSRNDTHGRKCFLNMGNKLDRISNESCECVKDLESILTEAIQRKQEINRLIENLKEEVTKALRSIELTKSSSNASKFEN